MRYRAYIFRMRIPTAMIARIDRYVVEVEGTSAVVHTHNAGGNSFYRVVVRLCQAAVFAWPRLIGSSSNYLASRHLHVTRTRSVWRQSGTALHRAQIPRRCRTEGYNRSKQRRYEDHRDENPRQLRI